MEGGPGDRCGPRPGFPLTCVRPSQVPLRCLDTPTFPIMCDYTLLHCPYPTLSLPLSLLFVSFSVTLSVSVFYCLSVPDSLPPDDSGSPVLTRAPSVFSCVLSSSPRGRLLRGRTPRPLWCDSVSTCRCPQPRVCLPFTVGGWVMFLTVQTPLRRPTSPWGPTVLGSGRTSVRLSFHP